MCSAPYQMNKKHTPFLCYYLFWTYCLERLEALHIVQVCVYAFVKVHNKIYNHDNHFHDSYVCFGVMFLLVLNNVKIFMQSMIGRNMLEYQLRRLGVFGAEETISSHANLDESFKICKCIINFHIMFLEI